jgi:cation transporter-like permease
VSAVPRTGPAQGAVKRIFADTRENPNKEKVMLLIVYYVVFMISGDFAAYFLGLFVEYTWGPVASLWVFLTLYFLFLWFAWLLAVWMTEPKKAREISAGAAPRA